MPVPDRLVAAVADAGPLIHLDELDALPLLAGFTEVLVPAVVSTEVSRHRSGWTDRAPSCLREADPNPQTLRALSEEAMSADLDPGEMSALALWREHPDFVLLCDDLAARRTAERLGCEVAGTLGVVLWAARTGRLGAGEARTLIRAIPNQTTLHVRADLIEQVARGLDDA